MLTISSTFAKGYGLTESTGVASRMIGPGEIHHLGSVGRLSAYCEAKIVEPDTGITLSPGKPGELWIRGPLIMKGHLTFYYYYYYLLQYAALGLTVGRPTTNYIGLDP